MLPLAALPVLPAFCGNSDCKNCSLDGDYIGELYGVELKVAQDIDGKKCKKL
ncbi:hypothetical protein [Algoriphagus jejuensis]|uniref:hypothetical protein n=1 Tax=Algoriphagus jejuensis TaxID=419934 RepID=UPI0031D5E59B